MTRTTGIPTSRAYWALKAEQMLNRVFHAEAPIDVELVDPRPQHQAQGLAEGQGQWQSRLPAPAVDPEPMKRRRSAHALAALLQRRPELLPISVAGMGLAVTLTMAGLAAHWDQQQQALRQERNLLLLERLRALGPGTPSAVNPAEPAHDPSAAVNGLPPPPPSEPWMEELAQLPASGAPAAGVLSVPVSPRITAAAPSTAPSAAQGASPWAGLPQLVGVVQIPGRPGSAIFQIGGTSTSAGAGESIGGSGWLLRSASGDSAVIERGGEQRRLSVSSGF